MALSAHMIGQHDEVKTSHGDDDNNKKRKMTRGEKKSAGNAKPPPGRSPGGGRGGGRPRRVDDFGGFEAGERSSGRDPVVDRRFFDGENYCFCVVRYPPPLSDD